VRTIEKQVGFATEALDLDVVPSRWARREYEVVLALLSSAGITSLFVLLVDLLLKTPLAMVFAVPLLPGGLLDAIVLRSKTSIGLFPNLSGVLLGNICFYAVIIYIAIRFFCQRVAPAAMRRWVIRLVFPVIPLFGIACVPALDPFQARGMQAMENQQLDLKSAFQEGVTLDDARTLLRAKHVAFSEANGWENGVLLQRPEKTIKTQSGDHVISIRLATEASQFPCTYEIQAILVFGKDQTLRDKFIGPWPVCP
jgi:hypothetical protein